MFLEATPAFTNRKPTEQKLLRVVCGFVAGLAVGLSSAVWRIALIAETWALSILLFTIILSLVLRWMGRPERRRFLYGAFFVFGLLLTSNQEFLVMTPALLLLVVLGDRELGRDLALVVLLLVFTVWAVGTLDVVARLNPLVSKHLRWIVTATVYVNGIPSTASVLNIAVPAPTPTLTDAKRLSNGSFQFAFTNTVRVYSACWRRPIPRRR